MKFGFSPGRVDLSAGGSRESVAGIIGLARLAQESGFDSVWLDEEDFSGGGPGAAALVAAAAVAACTSAIRIGVIVPLGLTHPVYTAEDFAVLDNISAGRVIAALRPPSGAAGAAARFEEALEVCLRAWAPGPFRFRGEHFRIPANLPQNGPAAALAQVSVTPKPAQPRLPVWILATDDTAVRLAARFALPIIIPAGESLEPARSAFGLHRELLAPEPVGSPAALMRDVDPAHMEALIQETERCRDEMGVNYLICRPARGTDAAQAIALLSRCLVPEFRMYGYPRELRSLTL